MTARGTLRFTFASAEAATRAHASLAPDDDRYVSTHVEGPLLVIEATAPDARGLLRALDDVLAQVTVYEDLIRDARGAAGRA